MVERVTSNDEVAGSIPSEGIEAFFFLSFNFLAIFSLSHLFPDHFLYFVFFVLRIF